MKYTLSAFLRRLELYCCRQVVIYSNVNLFFIRMTYCEIFTIGKADCLFMKKIGNQPITEADTDFSKIRTEF